MLRYWWRVCVSSQDGTKDIVNTIKAKLQSVDCNKPSSTERYIISSISRCCSVVFEQPYTHSMCYSEAVIQFTLASSFSRVHTYDYCVVGQLKGRRLCTRVVQKVLRVCLIRVYCLFFIICFYIVHYRNLIATVLCVLHFFKMNVASLGRLLITMVTYSRRSK